MTIKNTAVTVNISEAFDWRTFVKKHKPGQDSELQRQRLSMYQRVLPELEKWSTVSGLNIEEWSTICGYELSKGRVKSCAYYGICAVESAVESIDYDLALLLAKLCLWLYAMDIRLDDSPSISCLDARSIEIISPFKEQLIQQGILNLTSDLSAVPNKEEDNSIDRTIAQVLSEIYLSLKQVCNTRLSSSDQEFCLSKFVNELATVIKSMHWERKHSLVFQQADHLSPAQDLQITLEEYLDLARITTCYRVVASFVLAFETAPSAIWVQWEEAMRYGGRIVRLANDMATVLREMEEGKINAVSIVLRDLGFNPFATYSLDSPEIREALRLLKEQREVELIRFNQQLKALPLSGPFAHNVIVSMAFGVAMYEKGDFEPELPPSQIKKR
ncbi:class 1 isoprenoid biosynthesis enzyme [Tolypothrix campylonemoides VB511288]|nr:class 1 isoprenoid biosynthesis enzyme [Tolypothrix campylonemoides VB511288]